MVALATTDVTTAHAKGPPPASNGDLFIDALAQECYEGRMRSCDDLYDWTWWSGDTFEDYGYTCGYRLSYDAVDNRYCTAIW